MTRNTRTLAICLATVAVTSLTWVSFAKDDAEAGWNTEQRESYRIGYLLGQRLTQKTQGMSADMIAQGLKDAMNGNEPSSMSAEPDEPVENPGYEAAVLEAMSDSGKPLMRGDDRVNTQVQGSRVDTAVEATKANTEQVDEYLNENPNPPPGQK